MQSIAKNLKKDGKSLGLVPTMGFLHEGHSSLVRYSRAENDITIVSIFVNPTQFAPNEDFSRYPRDFERDRTLMENEAVDYIFAPEASDIYPDGFSTYVVVEKLSEVIEGEIRPAHFKGVTTVVNILFNATLADNAYFGQKDAQQATILFKMATEQCSPVKVHIKPIVREADGLALSSRNIYLSSDERRGAVVLSESLAIARDLLMNGERKSAELLRAMQVHLSIAKTGSLDYVKIVTTNNFHSTDQIETGREYFILVAYKFGKTRLIDNLYIDFRNNILNMQ